MSLVEDIKDAYEGIGYTLAPASGTSDVPPADFYHAPAHLDSIDIGYELKSRLDPIYGGSSFTEEQIEVAFAGAGRVVFGAALAIAELAYVSWRDGTNPDASDALSALGAGAFGGLGSALASNYLKTAPLAPYTGQFVSIGLGFFGGEILGYQLGTYIESVGFDGPLIDFAAIGEAADDFFGSGHEQDPIFDLDGSTTLDAPDAYGYGGEGSFVGQGYGNVSLSGLSDDPMNGLSTLGGIDSDWS